MTDTGTKLSTNSALSSIYLAGKIGKNDWRHDVVKDLRGAWGTFGENIHEDWPVLELAVLDRFNYVGPYFISDDHGCWHGAGTHGCGRDGEGGGCSSGGPHRELVRDLCLTAIRRTDVFFAWLDDTTAYGTLAEIGYAHALGKRIIIGAPKSSTLLDDDMWFAQTMSETVLWASTPREALEQLMEANPRLDSPVEFAFWSEWQSSCENYPLLNGLVARHAVLGGRYRLDFALPQQKIGIEVDGWLFHSDKDVFTTDRERQRRLEGAGWRIIRFSGEEVAADAAACIREAARLVASFEAHATSRKY
ncbi:DUF559 domain-containing protein (plasmid) [Microtetraspora malaysiensis]|uniref:DUF559 domain-containing protein n=1 Tax=Microtetraspora malaysiensis TaxID=161358 RepID=UPI003D8D357C